MLRMYREIGDRYGTRLAGWFIDGGSAYYWRNFSFRQLLIALKTGNPSRVVTFFQWIFPTFSPYSGDFTSDLVDFGAPLAHRFRTSGNCRAVLMRGYSLSSTSRSRTR